MSQLPIGVTFPESEVTRFGGFIETVRLVLLGDRLPRSVGKGGKGRLPRKNVYYAVDRRRGGIYRTPHAEQFIGALRAEAARIGLGVDREKTLRPICNGYWVLDLLVGAPEAKRTLELLVPKLDSDACLSPVKDALQESGILDDDGRIVRDSSTAVLSRGNPFVIVELRRIGNPELAIQDRWPWASYYFA